jgi:hypothetical protein
VGVYLVTWKLNPALEREKAELEALQAGLTARLEAYEFIHDEEFESVYFVSAPLSPGQVSADLHGWLDRDDKIIVAQVLEGTYCGWLPQPMWDWIEERL